MPVGYPEYFDYKNLYKQTLEKLVQADQLTVDARGNLKPANRIQKLFEAEKVSTDPLLVELKVVEFITRGAKWLTEKDFKQVELLTQKAGLFLGNRDSVKNHRLLRWLVGAFAKDVWNVEKMSALEYAKFSEAFYIRYRRYFSQYSPQCEKLVDAYKKAYQEDKEKAKHSHDEAAANSDAQQQNTYNKAVNLIVSEGKNLKKKVQQILEPKLVSIKDSAENIVTDSLNKSKGIISNVSAVCQKNKKMIAKVALGAIALATTAAAVYYGYQYWNSFSVEPLKAKFEDAQEAVLKEVIKAVQDTGQAVAQEAAASVLPSALEQTFFPENIPVVADTNNHNITETFFNGDVSIPKVLLFNEENNTANVNASLNDTVNVSNNDWSSLYPALGSLIPLALAAAWIYQKVYPTTSSSFSTEKSLPTPSSLKKKSQTNKSPEVTVTTPGKNGSSKKEVNLEEEVESINQLIARLESEVNPNPDTFETQIAVIKSRIAEVSEGVFEAIKLSTVVKRLDFALPQKNLPGGPPPPPPPPNSKMLIIRREIDGLNKALIRLEGVLNRLKSGLSPEIAETKEAVVEEKLSPEQEALLKKKTKHFEAQIKRIENDWNARGTSHETFHKVSSDVQAVINDRLKTIKLNEGLYTLLLKTSNDATVHQETMKFFEDSKVAYLRYRIDNYTPTQKKEIDVLAEFRRFTSQELVILLDIIKTEIPKYCPDVENPENPPEVIAIDEQFFKELENVEVESIIEARIKSQELNNPTIDVKETMRGEIVTSRKDLFEKKVAHFKCAKLEHQRKTINNLNEWVVALSGGLIKSAIEKVLIERKEQKEVGPLEEPAPFDPTAKETKAITSSGGPQSIVIDSKVLQKKQKGRADTFVDPVLTRVAPVSHDKNSVLGQLKKVTKNDESGIVQQLASSHFSLRKVSTELTFEQKLSSLENYIDKYIEIEKNKIKVLQLNTQLGQINENLLAIAQEQRKEITEISADTENVIQKKAIEIQLKKYDLYAGYFEGKIQSQTSVLIIKELPNIWGNTLEQIRSDFVAKFVTKSEDAGAYVQQFEKCISELLRAVVEKFLNPKAKALSERVHEFYKDAIFIDKVDLQALIDNETKTMELVDLLVQKIALIKNQKPVDKVLENSISDTIESLVKLESIDDLDELFDRIKGEAQKMLQSNFLKLEEGSNPYFFTSTTASGQMILPYFNDNQL